jgi:hypothetical protein
MGKKQLIIAEYDVETGVVDVRYYGLSLRSEAKKILIKQHQSLFRSLSQGFNPNQLVDEEVDENGGAECESESGRECQPESGREQEPAGEYDEDGAEAGDDREEHSGGAEPEPTG